MRHRTGQLFITSIFGQALYRFSSFFIILAAARKLTPYELGAFNLLITYSYIAATIMIFGFDALYNREASAGRERPGTLEAIGISKCALLAAGTPITLLLTWTSLGASMIPLALLVLASVALAGFSETSETLFVNRNIGHLRAWALGLPSLLSMIAALVLIVTPNIDSILPFALTLLLRDSLRFSIGMVGLVRLHRNESWLWPRLPAIRNLFLQSFPFASLSIMFYLAARIDVTIVGFLLGAKEVGIYTPAATLVFGAAVIPTGVGPVMVKLLTERRELVVRLALAFSALGLLAAVGIAALGLLFNKYLGANYENSQGILLILCLSIPFAYTNSVIAKWLFVESREAAVNVFILFTMLLNITMNLCLLKTFGISAAAWTTVATEVAFLALMLVYIYRLKSSSPAGPIRRPHSELHTYQTME